MIDFKHCAARLPAQDLERARASKGKGKGERACWFPDSEGNLIGMGEVVR